MDIDKEIYKILSGGIISIVDATDGKKIVGIASASEVITDFIENLLEQEKKRMSEAVKESCSCSSHVDGCSGETYIDIVLSIINKKRVCQEVQK